MKITALTRLETKSVSSPSEYLIQRLLLPHNSVQDALGASKVPAHYLPRLYHNKYSAPLRVGCVLLLRKATGTGCCRLPGALNATLANAQRYDHTRLGGSGGRAGLLRPAEGETLRALALRLRRAAKEQGRPLTIHKAEGELVFWFAGAKLRGRPAKAADKT